MLGTTTKLSNYYAVLSFEVVVICALEIIFNSNCSWDYRNKKNKTVKM